MKRLSENSIDLNQEIRKLEGHIYNESVTKVYLNGLQKRLDHYVDGNDISSKAYELQALIYYALNDKQNSLEFISDAIALDDNLHNYSRTGALLAELYLSESNAISEKKQEISDEVEEPTKKYSGKLEGWLALYTLRLVFVPFVYLVDLFTVIDTDFTEFSSDFEGYLIFAGFSDFLLIVAAFISWYFYFKKRRVTTAILRFLEAFQAVFYFTAAIWLQSLFDSYGITHDGEVGKLVFYGIVAVAWSIYWFQSRRVKETFVNE